MFEKLIGYTDLKKELEMLVDTLVHPAKYKALGAVPPRNILLHGECGIGKSSLASEFVSATGRKAYTLRKNKPSGDFVNYIKSVFDEAMKNQPSIVLCEDCCKFANEDDSHRDAEEYVTLQSCIDEVVNENADVFVIATANDIRRLPTSLIRKGRFDKVIKMRHPMGDDAIKIIEHYLKDKILDEDVSASEIGKLLDGASCATLENVTREAGLYAGFEGRKKINRNDLIRAAMRIIFDAPESSETMKYEDAKRIAVHECGHAIVAMCQELGSVNLVSINRHGGNVGGITSYTNNESYWYSTKYMSERVVVLLAGKAATELVYGEGDVGCNEDLHRAFDIVERFVDDYTNFGFDKFERRSSSPTLLEKKETYIHAELDRYYARAKQIISQNRAFFDVLVEEVIRKKTITGDEIRKLWCSSSKSAG